MFDVVTIGTATRDAFIKSKDFHIDSDRHVLGGKGLVMPLGAKLEIPEIYFSTGGGATNAAVTFARLGFKTACVAVVGDDVSGGAVIRDLKHEKVYRGFIKKKKKPTAYSILLESLSGERTVLVYRGASEDMDEKSITWSRLRARWFYVSSLAGNLRLLKRIVAFALTNNIRIAYNPGGKELKQRQKLLPFLKHIDILIANREEAALITGVSYKNEKNIFKKWDKMSPGINVLTDARRGVWVSDGKNIYKAGIYKEKKIVDRTGAGDAFGSGFVAGIMRTPKDLARAVKLGSANATSKVEGMGAKYGLLTWRQFEGQKRWKYLPIKINKI
ncbi:MAG: carbohydrate kinase family protein [bacterium]|nr:carbohydrate kinase family protein [bacterium]